MVILKAACFAIAGHGKRSDTEIEVHRWQAEMESGCWLLTLALPSQLETRTWKSCRAKRESGRQLHLPSWAFAFPELPTVGTRSQNAPYFLHGPPPPAGAPAHIPSCQSDLYLCPPAQSQVETAVYLGTAVPRHNKNHTSRQRHLPMPTVCLRAHQPFI